MNMIVRGLYTLYSSIRYALFGRDGDDAVVYFLIAASWSLRFDNVAVAPNMSAPPTRLRGPLDTICIRGMWWVVEQL